RTEQSQRDRRRGKIVLAPRRGERRSAAGASRDRRRRLRVARHAPPALRSRRECPDRKSRHQVAFGPVADDRGPQGSHGSQNRGARVMISKSPAALKVPASGSGARTSWSSLLVRCAVTALLVGGYYWLQQPLAELVSGGYARATGRELEA